MSFDFDNKSTNNNSEEIWGFDFDTGNYFDITSNNEEAGLQPQQGFEIENTKTNRGKKGERSKNKFRKTTDVPWRILCVTGTIAVVVILCVVFRQQITDFLMTVLSWVIIIVILYLILKIIFFHRRRR